MTMEFKDILSYWLTQKKMSRYRLSEKTSISESHIRNLVTGLKQPTYPMIKTIAEAFDLTVAEFLNAHIDDPIYLSENDKKMLTAFRALPSDKASLMIEFIEKLNDCNE